MNLIERAEAALKANNWGEVDPTVRDLARLAVAAGELVPLLDKLDRSYETEYAGRMYELCTGCGCQLSNLRPHKESCAWTAIDAALARFRAIVEGRG